MAPFLRTALWILLLIAPALADTVTLRNGSRFKGTIVAETAHAIVLQTEGGTLTLKKADVLNIEKDPPSPPQGEGRNGGSSSPAPGKPDAKREEGPKPRPAQPRTKPPAPRPPARPKQVPPGQGEGSGKPKG